MRYNDSGDILILIILTIMCCLGGTMSFLGFWAGIYVIGFLYGFFSLVYIWAIGLKIKDIVDEYKWQKFIEELNK